MGISGYAQMHRVFFYPNFSNNDEHIVLRHTPRHLPKVYVDGDKLTVSSMSLFSDATMAIRDEQDNILFYISDFAYEEEQTFIIPDWENAYSIEIHIAGKSYIGYI